MQQRTFLIFIAFVASLGLVGLGVHIYKTHADFPEQLPDLQELVDVIKQEDPSPDATQTGPELFDYIEVIDSCGPYHDGNPCVNVRSGPGVDFEKITTLRNGVVLRVDSSTTAEDGRIWYKIKHDSWLRYPERVTTDWYVAGDYVRAFKDIGQQDLKGKPEKKSKIIIVSLQKEMLYAQDGDDLFLESAISTGRDEAPTEPGVFTIYRKTPSRYMQGPLPGSTDEYDLPGVPWSMYFTVDGAVIHGAYWHDRFGQPQSHGCINLPPNIAEELYQWAEVGMKVVIID